MQNIKPKQIQFYINREVMVSNKINPEEVQKALINLGSIFKQDIVKIIPTQINDISTLQFLLELNKNLDILKSCKGFHEHIFNYTSHRKPTDFVTRLASFLIQKVDSLILEPPVPKSDKKADILVILDREEIYIECKSIINEIDVEYSKEHYEMFKAMSEHISTHYQITITYEKPLSNEKILSIADIINKRIPYVTSSGSIYSDFEIDIHITKSDTPSDRRFIIMLIGLAQDSTDNKAYPSTMIFKGGLTITFSGPNIDYSKFLLQKFKSAKKQSPLTRPFILAIDGNYILGDYKQLIRDLQKEFQPKKYTRFGGLLIVKSSVMENKFHYSFNFIQNPYAKFPVPKKFINLFLK